MGYDKLMIANGKGRKVEILKIIKSLCDQKNEKQKSKNVDTDKSKVEQTPSEANEPEDIHTFERMQNLANKKKLEHKKQLKQITYQAVNNQDNQSMSSNVTTNNQTNLPLAMQYRQAIQTPRKVEVGPSKIHRIGLFTCEDLKPHDIVIEYVGEIITNELSDLREKQYNERGFGDCYMFRLDGE